ncbi:MAG: hypothetical protein QOJ39_716 [Candidatus Eremiobacteraeota bacterium]|jgi:hypothetical protein|nr:hypothetical protein [Candidatus Eremiobacteraeota bacterium]MEA2718852.1 hypothetical protein [Candidatus Eremiobacteraeota bacterium]
MRTFVAVLALFAASIASALAQPAQRCSRETFPVGGQNVAVTVCAGAPDGGKTVAVTETFKNAAASFNHVTSIEVLPGAAASRAVDDVSLAPLGLNYTLHLTLVHREASVAIEHALLLPGAVPLK